MNAHQDIRRFVCPVPGCGITICEDHGSTMGKALRRHYETGHWLTYCRPCDEMLESASAKSRHCARAHRDTYCLLCEKMFESPGALQRHKDNESVYCIYCHQTFHSVGKRDEHMLAVHKASHCSVCEWRIGGGNKCKCELDRDARRIFKEAGKQQGKNFPQQRSSFRFGISPDSFFTGPFTRNSAAPKSPPFGKADFSGKEWQYRDSSAKPKGSEHKPRERKQQNPNAGSSKPGRREEKPSPPRTAAKPPTVDYYALIGIPITATHDEILKATKKARIANHPDRFIGKNLPPQELAQVTERSKCIGQACDILESPRDRAIYDAKLKKEMLARKNVHTPDRSQAQERKPASPFQPKANRQAPPKPTPGGGRADMKHGYAESFMKNQYESDRSQWPGTPPQAPKEEFRRAAPPKRDSSAFAGWKSNADIKFSYERYRKTSEKPDEDVDMVDVDGSRVRW